MNDLSITKGDTSKLTISVKDSDGVVFDLDGYTMTFTAKKNPESEVAITSTAVISDASSGVGVITLLPTDTKIDSGEYRYDVEITNGGSDTYTVVKNSLLTITDEITS